MIMQIKHPWLYFNMGKALAGCPALGFQGDCLPPPPSPAAAKHVTAALVHSG